MVLFGASCNFIECTRLCNGFPGIPPYCSAGVTAENADYCQAAGATLICPNAKKCTAGSKGSKVICPKATQCRAEFDGIAICKSGCRVFISGTCVEIDDLAKQLNNPNDYENLIKCISSNPNAYQSCPACVNSKNYDACLKGA